MDCSPAGSSVHGILQARVLEGVAMLSSRGSSQPKDRTQVSHIAFFTIWAAGEALPGGASGTELACQCRRCTETWVWSLGWEDPLEEGIATLSSILAWRIPWTEEPGGLQSMGLQRVRHDWSDSTHTAQCQLFWLFQLLSICYQDGSLQLCSDLCWDSVTRQRGEECRLSSPSWGILRFWDSVTSSFKKNFIYLTVQGLSCHTWDLYSLLHHSGSFSCSTWNLF